MMTERVDHAAEACHALMGSGDGRNFATDASVNAVAHAVLALVEQQRIANLIALSVGDWDHGQAIDALAVRPQMGTDAYPLRPEVAAALGIETGEREEVTDDDE